MDGKVQMHYLSVYSPKMPVFPFFEIPNGEPDIKNMIIYQYEFNYITI